MGFHTHKEKLQPTCTAKSAAQQEKLRNSIISAYLTISSAAGFKSYITAVCTAPLERNVQQLESRIFMLLDRVKNSTWSTIPQAGRRGGGVETRAMKTDTPASLGKDH